MLSHETIHFSVMCKTPRPAAIPVKIPVTTTQQSTSTGSSGSKASRPEGTCSEQPPAVVAVSGALAVVAEAAVLVLAGLPVHHETLLGALLRQAGAVLG